MLLILNCLKHMPKGKLRLRQCLKYLRVSENWLGLVAALSSLLMLFFSLMLQPLP